ncbi:SDR family NAD(P)-dependent oxidoreductase [Saccharomonospora sp. NPDC046836]|uniref:SDR family oxidoreductase n=1 Tax=Saccharomonospora sp. NPDC046836 TaxID=3156921 RepID=UPI0034060538
MERLAGTTAFITGGAQGIGLGIARSLARQGVTLAIADRDEAALDRAAAELAPLTDVATFPLDVRDRAGYTRIADEVERRLGPVSVLCNNAGVAFPESLTDLSYELWDLAIEINFGGVVNGIQTFLPRMLDRDTPGHVVNTASAAGLVAAVGPMYSSAKFAVVGLSEALRTQLDAAAAPIGVTVLCPGAVATNLAHTTQATLATTTGDDRFDQARERIERLTPNVDAALTNHGIPPDSVGDLVVNAIKHNQLYVHTDRAGIDLITTRTDAILAAMPTTDQTTGTIDDFRNTIHQT